MKTKGVMRTIEFDYYEFEFQISSRGIRARILTVTPFMEHFGYFYSMYNSSKLIDDFIDQVNTKRNEYADHFIDGDNEYCIEVSGDILIFHVDMHGEPIAVKKEYFISVLLEFREWLLKYEHCEILGIIPESKLDTWSSVPNEYVKDEWWQTDQGRKQKGLKSEL